MDAALFAASPIGSLVRITGRDPRYGEDYDHVAYLAHPLPDEVGLRQDTYAAITRATAAVGRLDQAAWRLPNPQLLIRPAIRREAVSTSALEGTYAALDDVLEADFLQEAQLTASVAEVQNYVRAAEIAYRAISEQSVSVPMLSELQKVLVHNTRGDTPEAGQIRSTQVFIGSSAGRVHEARFVPAPPGDQLAAGLSDLIKWINADNRIPILVKMALGHYQFETLHPFNDGNGRLGRLVCVLQLAREGELRLPVLNISPWLEARRKEYQDHLLQVSVTGDFDPWVQFFSEAVRVQAGRAVDKIAALHDWRDDSLARLREAGVRGIAVQITEDMLGYPIITPSEAARRYSMSYPAINSAIRRLESLGIIRERSGRSYGRVYVATPVLRIYQSD